MEAIKEIALDQEYALLELTFGEDPDSTSPWSKAVK